MSNNSSSNKSCSEECEEAILETLSGSLSLPYTDEKPKQLKCGVRSKNCAEFVREGNQAYLLMTVEKDNSWVVESISCTECDMREEHERYNSETVAIVQATLVPEDENGIDAPLKLERPEIWELQIQ